MYGLAGLARVLAVVVMLGSAGLGLFAVGLANWPETQQQAGQRAFDCARAQTTAQMTRDPVVRRAAEEQARAVCAASVDARATDWVALMEAAAAFLLALTLFLAASAVRLGVEARERFDQVLARLPAPAVAPPAAERRADPTVEPVEEPGPQWSAARREAATRRVGG